MCLEYALVNRIDHGVWGGTSERERRRILKRRRAVASPELDAPSLLGRRRRAAAARSAPGFAADRSTSAAISLGSRSVSSKPRSGIGDVIEHRLVLVGPRPVRVGHVRRPPGRDRRPTRITTTPGRCRKTTAPCDVGTCQASAPFTCTGSASLGRASWLRRPGPQEHRHDALAVGVHELRDAAVVDRRRRAGRCRPAVEGRRRSAWALAAVLRRLGGCDRSAGHGGVGAHVAVGRPDRPNALALLTLTTPRMSSHAAAAPAMLASPNAQPALLVRRAGRAGPVAQDALVEAERRVDGGQVAQQPAHARRSASRSARHSAQPARCASTSTRSAGVSSSSR